MEIFQRRATSENKFVKWRILQSASCDHCNGEAENVLHALWKCSAISQVWRSVPEINFSPLRNFTTISDLILQAQNDGKDVEKLTMVVWTIWHWRNQIRAKNENYPISQVVLNTVQALQVFTQADHVALTQSITNVPPQIRWSPPPPNYLKVNFDGATFKDIGRAGISAVIHGNCGQVIASLSEQINLSFSSNMVGHWLLHEQYPLLWRLAAPLLSLKLIRNQWSRPLIVREKASHRMVISLQQQKIWQTPLGSYFLMYVGLIILLHLT